MKKRCTRLQSLVHQKMALVKQEDTDTRLRDQLREQHDEIQYLEHHTLLLEENVINWESNTMRYNIWSIRHCCWRRTWSTERATRWDTISGASDIAVGGECHRSVGATTGLGQARTDFPRGYAPCGFWRADQPGSHTEHSPPDRKVCRKVWCVDCSHPP